MKIIFLLSILLYVVVPAQSQNTETLFSSGTVNFGGGGGPAVGFSTIGDDFAVLSGGMGGLILNMDNKRSITLGGGGFGLANVIRVDRSNPNANENILVFGYGGFLFEYTDRTNKLVHLTFRNILGGGHLGYRSSIMDGRHSSGNQFFVTEPGINVELNVTHYFRIAAGAYYRLVAGSNVAEFSDNDLSGFAGQLTFKFGKF